MHRLSNAHMLRFHDWYETKNNLWLILEYCAGGNLENILQQDGHLPESSIRIFGLDMISGLKVLVFLALVHASNPFLSFALGDLLFFLSLSLVLVSSFPWLYPW
jgi:serine/threonine protein kinase